MNILIVLSFFISWFFTGLVGGIICSWVDCRYNNFPTIDYKGTVKFSFLGLLLLLWSFYFWYNSKKEAKLRW